MTPLVQWAHQNNIAGPTEFRRFLVDALVVGESVVGEEGSAGVELLVFSDWDGAEDSSDGGKWTTVSDDAATLMLVTAAGSAETSGFPSDFVLQQTYPTGGGGNEGWIDMYLDVGSNGVIGERWRWRWYQSIVDPRNLDDENHGIAWRFNGQNDECPWLVVHTVNEGAGTYQLAFIPPLPPNEDVDRWEPDGGGVTFDVGTVYRIEVYFEPLTTSTYEAGIAIYDENDVLLYGPDEWLTVFGPSAFGPNGTPMEGLVFAGDIRPHMRRFTGFNSGFSDGTPASPGVWGEYGSVCCVVGDTAGPYPLPGEGN